MIVEQAVQFHRMIIGQQPMGMAIRMIKIVSKNLFERRTRTRFEIWNSNK